MAKVTRRKLLKRAGIGVGALSAGSLVTATTASAVGFCHDCECGPCSGQVNCHHDNGSCIPTTEGTCFCHQSSSCGVLESCSDSSDCPPGWACALSCCGGGNTLLCLPPVGTQAAGSEAAGGPMSGPSGGATGGQGQGSDVHAAVRNPFVGH